MGTAARLSRANAPRQGVHGGFLHSAERYAHRPAVEVRGTILTYDELRSRAMSLAASLQRATPSGGPPLTDRKSTRLNSSHRCISYAVFCLKKKKKNIKTIYTP